MLHYGRTTEYMEGALRNSTPESSDFTENWRVLQSPIQWLQSLHCVVDRVADIQAGVVNVSDLEA